MECEWKKNTSRDHFNASSKLCAFFPLPIWFGMVLSMISNCMICVWLFVKYTKKSVFNLHNSHGYSGYFINSLTIWMIGCDRLEAITLSIRDILPMRQLFKLKHSSSSLITHGF